MEREGGAYVIFICAWLVDYVFVYVWYIMRFVYVRNIMCFACLCTFMVWFVWCRVSML